MRGVTIAFALLCFIVSIDGIFYLPGVAPVDYEPGSKVELKVNKIESVHTQIPYKYYSLPFCQPENGVQDMAENLGEILLSDRIENSPYVINTKENRDCVVLNHWSKCNTHFDKYQLKQFSDKIKEDYRINWFLDNLPAATAHPITEANGKTITIYETGFPMGQREDPAENKDAVFINNHVAMTILYNQSPTKEGAVRIVGFEVAPMSVRYENWDGNTPNCPFLPQDSEAELQSVQPVDEGRDIIFTYSVLWKEDPDTLWTQRWDKYLQNADAQIHWFSIINSLMIVLFLTGMVAMIMMRTLRADLRRYNQMDPNEEVEETGWKLVHGDVFRPPTRPMALSVLVGSGVQVFGMTVVTLLFAVLGFLSPANRGSLMTAVVVLIVVMGVFAGYFSSRCYKTFKGQHWKKNTLFTAFAFPGVCFGIFFFLNFVLVSQRSAGAVPAGTLVSLFALWFGVSIPLVFFGSYFGWKKPLPDEPVRTNQIPRQIPEQVWYMSPILSILMGGILPFGAIFIELFFILTAIWGHQFYYIFGFLFIVFVILILTCAEITIVMCYFQLCAEDYHWWWRSFLTAGASAFYMFLYSIFYFFTKLEIDRFVSGLLYFGYMFIMAFAFFVMTGAVGFYACHFFVRKIYGSIKVE